MAKLKEINELARTLRESEPGLTWKEAQKKAGEILSNKNKEKTAAAPNQPKRSIWCNTVLSV
ncbi:MAG: hypothetical protein GYA62_15300 [Bacteroidales bacterium]|nr:hypothetical protein [Bacteroidales bacterium]